MEEPYNLAHPIVFAVICLRSSLHVNDSTCKEGRAGDCKRPQTRRTLCSEPLFDAAGWLHVCQSSPHLHAGRGA